MYYTGLIVFFITVCATTLEMVDLPSSLKLLGLLYNIVETLGEQV